jgi:hypothetical protein
MGLIHMPDLDLNTTTLLSSAAILLPTNILGRNG